MQTYFMVGAGGTGTHLLPVLLPFLRNFHGNKEEDFQVVIADGDAFEEKNLARQLFTEGLVTINKAEAMLHMYPGFPIIAVSRNVGKVDIETMVQNGDIVLICADNYSVRALIVDHAKTLDDVVVVNAGNELEDGSVQLWVRKDGENVTPPITYGHPEIRYIAEDDRSTMTCAEVAALEGGEQTILANQAAAHHMMTAIWRYLTGQHTTGWTELLFDLRKGETHHINMRERRNWAKNP